MKKVGLIAASMFACIGLLGMAPLAQAQYYPGQQPVIFTVQQPPAETFTAASTNGATFATPAITSGVIEVKGVALTTATWEIEGSIDGGTTWQVIPTAAFPTTALPSTLAASQTTTASGTFYLVNVAGFNRFRFLTTSGTFTGTSIAIQLSAVPEKGML